MKKNLLLVLIAACLTVEVRAARIPRPASKRPAPTRPQRPQRPTAPPRANPAEEVEMLSRMPTPERERALAALSPKQQNQIESRLDNLERMDPTQREQLLDRYRKFEGMTPRQKQQIREGLRRLQTLPPARRAAVMQEVDSLKSLPVAERSRRLSSDEIRSRFTPEERQIIEQSSTMLAGRM